MTHQPNVLIVDDDVNIISAFEGFLKKEHCSMLASSIVEDALRTLETLRVDLVISDILLSQQSGVTLLIRIKRLYPRLPVIVITGHPSLITKEDVRFYGADYYFLKPLELDALRSAVRNCLRLAGTTTKRSSHRDCPQPFT